jgi:hypothetical protein
LPVWVLLNTAGNDVLEGFEFGVVFIIG